jgi:hypothetical protein
VISSKGSKVPDLAESERGENIIAIKYIAADSWQMDPWFIFKGIFLPILINNSFKSSYPF